MNRTSLNEFKLWRFVVLFFSCGGYGRPQSFFQSHIVPMFNIHHHIKSFSIIFWAYFRLLYNFNLLATAWWDETEFIPIDWCFLCQVMDWKVGAANHHHVLVFLNERHHLRSRILIKCAESSCILHFRGIYYIGLTSRYLLSRGIFVTLIFYLLNKALYCIVSTTLGPVTEPILVETANY